MHPNDEAVVHAPIDVRVTNQTEAEPLKWTPHTYAIPPGQPIMVAAYNRNRKRMIMFTDAGNTSPVLLSASNTGQPAISLGAGSAVLEMQHCDAVYAASTAVATLYVFEEGYR